MKGVTPYQLEILQHVAAAPAEEPIDFDQLLDKLSWRPSKESAQFPIRSLVAKGFVKKGSLSLRRGRQRVTYLLTEKGKKLLDPRLGSGKGDSSTPGASSNVSGKLSAESANKADENLKISQNQGNESLLDLPPELFSD